MNKLIEIRGLEKTYDGKKMVLNDLNFDLKKGELVTIYGESGCGKSTFLNTMGLLDMFNKGDMKILGENIKPKAAGANKRMRAANLGFIFQAYCLIEAVSVIENVRMPFLYMSGKEVPSRKEVGELLEKLNLKNYEDRMVNSLSGGEKQRVAIARAMIKRPHIILADEPTGNLDEINSKIVARVLREVANEGTGVIIVTHNKHLDFGADRRYSLIEGRLQGC